MLYVAIWYVSIRTVVMRVKEELLCSSSFTLITGPGAHPASYTTGTGSFPGVSGRSVAMTTNPHLAPRLKEEQSYTSTPPLGLRGLFWGELYLYLYLYLQIFNVMCLRCVMNAASTFKIYVQYFSTLPHKRPDFLKEKKKLLNCFDFVYKFCMKHFSF